MNHPARPPALKSLPTTHQPQANPNVLPGLYVRMSARPPVALWACACGHLERALGKEAVIELTGRVRVGICPHTADQQTAPAAVGGPMGAARQGVRSSTVPRPTNRPQTTPVLPERRGAA
ncbi:hypothetical protein [Streptomyces sp. C10-9-1]|uniref:hypothetical protein n=1 Tax=Streptomyces sp. C10-9-1 TaxID=1859285 RepID=UPI003D71A265